MSKLILGMLASVLVTLAPGAFNPAKPPPPKFGMLYFPWHCMTKGRPIYDISAILRDGTPPGPVPEFHWWGRPTAGYYCLSDRNDILANHARLLAKAGIDFIIVDFSNHDSLDYGLANLEYLDPLAHLLAVWSKIPGAPKVVPFLPVTAKGDLAGEITHRLLAYRRLLFEFKGKPLMLIVDNQTFAPDPRRRAEFDKTFTTRLMWDDHAPAGDWSFISRCTADWPGATGRDVCRQKVAVRDGSVEQIAVTAAYQLDYMSDRKTAVSRKAGQTFLKQMARLDDFPTTPIVTILGWNQWIAQRLCVTPSLAADPSCRPGSVDRIGADYVFTDEFDQDYSNDFEPGADMGDAYYRLLACEIGRRKAGGSGYCALVSPN